MKQGARTFCRALLLLTCMVVPFSRGDDWRLFEDSIEIQEAVADDVFLLANIIRLNGTFGEDVWAAGRKVEITGTIQDDLRVAGAEVVNLSGTIGGDAHLLSNFGNVVVGTSSTIAGDSTLQAGKRITFAGKSAGDVWAQAPRIVIEGHIGGTLTLSSNDIQFLPGATIEGDLVQLGTQPLPLPKGVTVLGERIQTTADPSDLSQRIAQLRWMIKGIQFVTAFLIGLIMLRAFPVFTGQNIDLLLQRQAPLVSVGLFSFILFILAGYFLLITVIGSGVGVFLLLVTGMLFYLGKLFVAFVIGMMILRQTTELKFRKLALALILGLAVLYSLSSIPYIGDSLYLLASCWGMGAMLVSLRLSQKPLHFSLPDSNKPETP